MSGNIGVKLDRMNALLTQILERLPAPDEPVFYDDDEPRQHFNGPSITELAKDAEFIAPIGPKKRGWPKGKPRKVSG